MPPPTPARVHATALRIDLSDSHLSDPFADGFGHVAAQQHSTKEFEHGGKADSLLHSWRINSATDIIIGFGSPAGNLKGTQEREEKKTLAM